MGVTASRQLDGYAAQKREVELAPQVNRLFLLAAAQSMMTTRWHTSSRSGFTVFRDGARPRGEFSGSARVFEEADDALGLNLGGLL